MPDFLMIDLKHPLEAAGHDPDFPSDFIWGVATAATQIEGAADLDGKGPSIWDHFSRVPGHVHNGDTPAQACDHYHRHGEDFGLMRELGLRHYRFSANWCRVIPDGDGAINPRGLDFYDRLVDSMLAHGVQPWCTLYHWDLPLALERKGGWPRRETVAAFRRYADALVGRIGDRVTRWFTVNEPTCFVYLGYQSGGQAPFRKEAWPVVLRAHHHAMLAHAEGLEAVRAHGNRAAQVGFALLLHAPVPFSASADDLQAAREIYLRYNDAQLGAILRGGYPDSHLAHGGGDTSFIQPGDMERISAPVDFVGLNNYTGCLVRRGADGRAEELPHTARSPRTDSDWLVILPEAIYWTLRHPTELYGRRPIYITENGCSYDGAPAVNGEILDTDRIAFLRGYLREVARARRDGVDVKGYFQWSFLDNYEWAYGYRHRFGLVHVNYATQQRTPKLSARWYSRLSATGRLA